MSKVIFKKGLLANLPAVITEGSFYVTTDERAIYLDVNSETRVRIGDFQEFDTLTALRANTNPSTSALYYVTELNCLAKWDGEKYVQINIDTGATSAEVTGTGNAIDGVTYDPATRKLTFTKTKTFTTASDVDSQIAAKVGELKIGEESFSTVKAYPNDASAMNTAITKLQAILTGIGGDGEKATVVAYVTDAIAALSIGDYAKAADLTALAARVTALETDSHTHTNKTELDKIAAGDKAKWDAAETKAHEHANATALDGVTDEKIASWDAAEQNAKDYTDESLTWGSF